jgi:hypothetical protein
MGCEELSTVQEYFCIVATVAFKTYVVGGYCTELRRLKASQNFLDPSCPRPTKRSE